LQKGKGAHVNLIREKLKMVAQEADRYGHLIERSSPKNIEQKQVAGPIPKEANAKGFILGPQPRPVRILAATDLTDDSRKAISYALYLTKLVEGELILLFFYDEGWRHLSSQGVQRDESMLVDESKQRKRLYALRDEVRSLYRNCNCNFYIGNPAKEIPKVASEMEVDLVVISSHHPRGSSHWSFGSDAERIVSHTTCPVLVVR
jgi:nucleotide-binding universal stress UspA family protein